MFHVTRNLMWYLLIQLSLAILLALTLKIYIWNQITEFRFTPACFHHFFRYSIWNALDCLSDKKLPREMFMEQQHVLSGAKLHFTPVVWLLELTYKESGEAKPYPLFLTLGRECNSLADSDVLLAVTEKLCCQARSTVLRVQKRSWDVSGFLY